MVRKDDPAIRLGKRLFPVAWTAALMGDNKHEDYEFHEQKYISSLVSSQLNGFKIAFISDVNLTDQDSITRFEKIVDELNEYPFDMVIFGGDLYDEQVFKADKVSQILKKIQCQYGKLAVLGEHDEASSLEVTTGVIPA